ncbi:MAG TPA: 6-carboxytetrahydropterin synthase [Ignavibacteriales bacterium]|nr:6-carboxytetrahydropterin synthase [Ignavibacteriales bacterium]HOL80451.1 6-carboxytetrahydropterin synthase [Ignavibacteriales bacterium]HPD68055.1 6-carboxytetrahydropterin synthase [Ignavibacteriales bacterium]HRR19102.1 6-carboxytetrahydropterin synthase [Ignavibacteriales bacterium]
MKIAKSFKWEMGHRLSFHKDKCANIHGHSYVLEVEMEGDILQDGMVLDYYLFNVIIKPLINELDHSCALHKDDTEFIEFFKKMNMKLFIMDNYPTAENLAIYILNYIKNKDLPKNIKKIKVKVKETENTYAEEEICL